MLMMSAGAAHPLSAIVTQLSLDDVAEVEDSGLGRIVGDRIVFRHPLVRSAVYHAAIPSARRAMHLRLASALVENDEARAWHLAAAAIGFDEPAATALEEAAENAQGRSGYAPAAAAFQRAAALTAEPAARARRLQRAAEAATLAGLMDLAASIISEAEALHPGTAQRAELAYLRGLLLIHAAQDATGVFAGAGRSLCAIDPGRAGVMLAWASEAALYERNWEAAAALAEEALALELDHSGVAQFWATWTRGVALTVLGRADEARAALNAAVAGFAENGLERDPRLLANYGAGLMYLGDFRGGLDAAASAEAAARRRARSRHACSPPRSRSPAGSCWGTGIERVLRPPKCTRSPSTATTAPSSATSCGRRPISPPPAVRASASRSWLHSSTSRAIRGSPCVPGCWRSGALSLQRRSSRLSLTYARARSPDMPART